MWEMQQSGLAAKFPCCFHVSIYLRLPFLPSALQPLTDLLSLLLARVSPPATENEKEKETSRDTDGQKEKRVSAGVPG